jgi:hypothetical protein
VGFIQGDPTTDEDEWGNPIDIEGEIEHFAAWNFVNSTMTNGPLPAYVARTGGDWSSRHTMAWSRKGASNQLVFGEIHWGGTETATPTAITATVVPNLAGGWNAQLGAWYMGASVSIPTGSTLSNATNHSIRSFYSKVVTAHDLVKRDYVTSTPPVTIPHKVINGGKTATHRAAFRHTSNGGSWGSQHSGVMVGAFGDGSVRMVNDTVAANVIVNLAATNATAVTSL